MPALSSSSSAAPPVLQAAALVKGYRSGDRQIAVLRGVDLTIAAGESVSIRGESGSGKSTLLHLLAGIDTPDAGAVHWDGRTTLPVERRAAMIGMVFQSFYLIPELNTFENVLMAARVAGAPRAAARTRARELLGRVGLAGRETHLPAQLSGGERQRAAIARALVNSPRLLLADEPTGNLDEQTGAGVIDLLLGLGAETRTALVLVTHNAAHAARTARQLFLHEGVLR